MDPEALPLLSSSPLLETQNKPVKPQDEIDMPTLVRVQAMLDEQIARCDSNATLDLSQSDFKVKEQVFLNRRLAENLRDIKLLVNTVIGNIKEKYE